MARANMEGGDRAESSTGLNENEQLTLSDNGRVDSWPSDESGNRNGASMEEFEISDQQSSRMTPAQYFLSPPPTFDPVFDDLLEGGKRNGTSNDSDGSMKMQERLDDETTRKMEYLNELLRDEKVLIKMPELLHLKPLLDREIERVRKELRMDITNNADFSNDDRSDSSGYFYGKFKIDHLSEMPPAEGPILTVVEKVYPAIDQYPDFNFIGRLVGPRGRTIKRIEDVYGCQITVRGRGSEKNRRFEEKLRGQPGFEHLKETLHVRIAATDHKERATFKVRCAKQLIEQLLVPIDDDELKQNQLRELARIRSQNRRFKRNSMPTTPFSPVPYLSPFISSPWQPLAIGSNEQFSIPPQMLTNFYYFDPAMMDANGNGLMTMIWPQHNTY